MMKTMRFFAILVVIVLGLTSCGREYPYQFKAKISLTIDTPSGVKTASSVVYFKYVYPDPNFRHWRLPEASGAYSVYRGEAVTFDMGDERYLFILLGEHQMLRFAEGFTFADIVSEFGKVDDSPALSRKFQERIDALKTAKTVLDIPNEIYPYFVTFDDIKNPDKLIKVDPANLAATFGPGYSLKSLTMTYTDEPVTTGKVIAAVGEGFFEKWDAHLLSRLDAEWPRYRDDFGQMLYRDTFIIGEDKDAK